MDFLQRLRSSSNPLIDRLRGLNNPGFDLVFPEKPQVEPQDEERDAVLKQISTLKSKGEKPDKIKQALGMMVDNSFTDGTTTTPFTKQTQSPFRDPLSKFAPVSFLSQTKLGGGGKSTVDAFLDTYFRTGDKAKKLEQYTQEFISQGEQPKLALQKALQRHSKEAMEEFAMTAAGAVDAGAAFGKFAKGKASKSLDPLAQEGYIYHATQVKNLDSITQKGIIPKTNMTGEKFSWFSRHTGWADDGNAILRVKESELKNLRAEGGTKDPKLDSYYTPEKVPPQKLEVSLDGGSTWKPLVSKELEPLAQEARKYKTAEEFVGKIRGSATQYGDYTPQLRQYGMEDYKNISELGVKPDETITIYRGIDQAKGKIKKQINDGDFVTTDFDSAASYAGKENVVSMEVPAKTLYTDAIDDFKAEPFYRGSEYVYTKQKVSPLTKSQLTDLYNEAHSPETFEGFKDITTNILNRLKGKSVTSKQEILDLTNMPELRQAERDLIRKTAEEYKGKIPVQEFANKVKTELLPLEVGKPVSNRVGGESGMTTARYENITLPDELRGPVASYGERVYNSPIKTSAGDVHFSGMSGNENYFAHTRIEDLPAYDAKNNNWTFTPTGGGKYKVWDQESGLDVVGEQPSFEAAKAAAAKAKSGDNTRRVIELQSDLFQKGRLEGELPEITKHKVGGKDVYSYVGKKGDFNSYEDAVSSRRKELIPLEPYRNTWHERVIREEVKQAAKDGKTKLQFPTGETAMKIEGLGESQYWSAILPDGNMQRLTGEGRQGAALKVGQEIAQNNDAGNRWIITDVLGDGKFKAISKDKLEDILEDGGIAADSIPVSQWIDEAKNMPRFKDTGNTEQFDISGKVDTNNPIYRFYEKDVAKFLTNKFGAKKITDPQGVSWFEVNVPKGAGKEPVQAYGRVGIGTVVATGAGIVGLTAIIKKFGDKKNEKEQFLKELGEIKFEENKPKESLESKQSKEIEAFSKKYGLKGLTIEQIMNLREQMIEEGYGHYLPSRGGKGLKRGQVLRKK